MKARVMQMAWGIAKNAESRFGGKATQYITEAMKMAWSLIKELDSYNASWYQKKLRLAVTVTNNGYSLEIRNSYYVKEEFKALGYRFDGLSAWYIKKNSLAEICEEVVSLYELHICTRAEEAGGLYDSGLLIAGENDFTDAQCDRVNVALGR